MNFSKLNELPDKSGVYCIKNINTEKVYIGSCVSFINRLKRHYYYLRNGMHHSQKLQRSWDKHGEDAFKIIIVELVDKDDLVEKEEFFIKSYDSYKNGYNMTDVCYNYKEFKQSDQALENFKKTRSKSVVAIDRFTGKYLTTYNSITEAAKAINDQTTNISSVCKGKLRYVKDIVFVYIEEYDPEKDYSVKEHHNKGIPKSKETREKMSKSSKSSHKVYKYDLEYNLIEEFRSVAFCEREEGFKKDTLRYKLDKPLDSGFIYTKTKKEDNKN